MTDTCDSVIRSLELHPSRLNKEAIVKAQAEAGNLEFFEGCKLACDPMTTFGVKKVPSHGGPDGQGLPWVAFKELCNLLSTRQLTGHDARDAIELALSASTQSQWNEWYRRILIKDLRCGTSETTINKVLKDFPAIPNIPVFECQLAHDGAKHEKKIKGKKLLDLKYDGVRSIIVIDANAKTATMHSRNGKLLENFNHITDAIEANIELFDRSMVLDGEIISSSFQALMTQVHRKSDVQSNDATLMLFDILPLSEFLAGKSTMGQRRRSNLLKSMKSVFDKVGNIEIVTPLEVDLDTYVGELQFKEFNLQAIVNGLEGIMVKDPDAIYECKRSHAWLKIKPVLTVDLTIVGVEEGTGKNEGKLGALVCEGTDQGKFIRVNVGSGLTDEQRDEIWADKDNVIGQVVEIKADAVTQNQDAEDYSLRFPRFERFRGFAVGEKI